MPRCALSAKDRCRHAKTSARGPLVTLGVHLPAPNRQAFREFQYLTSPLGTYASGFPDEHAFETWLLRLEQFADAEQRLAAGEHVSGPAARTYRDRTYRDRTRQANRQFAGRVLASSRQAGDLLANPTLQIYPAKGMTCVFDPAKAKCRLKPASDDARRTPDLTDCQPGGQNIARTDHDVNQLRSQAVELAADPLSPEPRRQRERHELKRLRAIIDEHDHNRPRRPPRLGGQPAGQSGQREDG